MKSVIYISTPTSGSASILRIVRAICDDHLTFADIPKIENRKPTIQDFNKENHLYLIRGTREVEAPVFSKDFRYVVNFRDPRDILCNQYHWLIQHPTGEESESEKSKKITEQRRMRHSLGIDNSVLRVKDDASFNFVFELHKAASMGAEVVFVSYAQLCCAFDQMVWRLKEFLNMPINEIAEDKIALEHPSNLKDNPNWIGQNWIGTDALPGRYRAELQPETIDQLNSRFAGTLATLAEIEISELRSLYDIDR